MPGVFCLPNGSEAEISVWAIRRLPVLPLQKRGRGNKEVITHIELVKSEDNEA